MPQIGTILESENGGSSRYSSPTFKVLTWADGSVPKTSVRFRVGNCRDLEPLDNASKRTPRAARAKALKAQLAKQRSSRAKLANQISSLQKQLDSLDNIITGLEGKINRLERYDTDEEELLAEARALMEAADDEHMFVKLLKNRDQREII